MYISTSNYDTNVMIYGSVFLTVNDSIELLENGG